MGCATLAKVAHIRMCSNTFGQAVYISPDLFLSTFIFPPIPKCLITKGNAREILSHTRDRFKEITNEAVGLVFTWNGGLTVLGSNAFKGFVSENKDQVWEAVGLTKSIDYSITKALLDQKMKSDIGDLGKLNVLSLRKHVSWLLQCQLGMLK